MRSIEVTADWLRAHVRRMRAMPLVALVLWPALPAADSRAQAPPAGDGRLAVVTRPNDPRARFRLELIDPGGGAAHPFAAYADRDAFYPSWSPDAQTVAFLEHANDVTSQLARVVLKPIDGGAEHVLLSDRAIWPSWSPVSAEIAYWLQSPSGQPLRYTLMVTTANGQSTRAVAGPFDPSVDMPLVGPEQPAWSADGGHITFAFRRGLVEVPAGGGTRVSVVAASTGQVARSPSHAPDGRRLAYLKESDTRTQLIVRDLVTGADRVVVDQPSSEGNAAGIRLDQGPQSWAPDSTRIAYTDHRSLPAPCPFCPSNSDSLVVIGAAGGGGAAILHRDGAGLIGHAAWSPVPAVPTVTIQAPAEPDNVLRGTEEIGSPRQRLTFHVESHKPLAGVCFAVQADPEPAPTSGACTNASGPTAAPFDHTTDLRPLVDNGTLKDGENVIRVWAYDKNGGRGSALVKVFLRRPSYYVKHIEVAQAVAPDLPPLHAVDPLAPDPIGFKWSVPAVAGFTIPLVAAKSTLVRIYVGDATLAPGQADERELSYRISGATLAQPVQRAGKVRVTAPDVAPTQADPVAALNVWLGPGAASSGIQVRLDVEVNADQRERECDDCYPNGNRASLDGIQFEEGGDVVLAPVPIHVIAPDLSVTGPTADYAKLWPFMVPMLPIGDSNLTAVAFPAAVAVRFDELLPQDSDAGEYYPCTVLLAKLEELRLLSGPLSGFGARRLVGLTSHPLAQAACNGMGMMPGSSFVLTRPRHHTAVHELGHTLGLAHVLGYGDVPGGAGALPYIGIGGVGYDTFGNDLDVYNKLAYGDIMSYSPHRWTSPFSWHRMFEAILAESGSPGPVASPSAARAVASTAGTRARRRLVSGVITGGRGLLMRSLVADAAQPTSTGALIGRVVARDRRGRRIAAADVRGSTALAPDEAPPFVVALPAKARIASLVLRSRRGGKPLARLVGSKHPPAARFLRLPKRAPARKPFRVGWRATDRDRDRVSVILLARRGKRAWRTVTMGPARYRTRVDPTALGSGKRLRLRLLVNDGFATTVVKSRVIRLKNR